MPKRALLWLVGLCLFGCGTPEAPPLKALPAATLPSGYTVHNAEKYGISIGIPGGWKYSSGQTTSLSSVVSDMGGSPSPDPSQMGGPMGKMLADNEKQTAEEEKAALAEQEAKGVIIPVYDTNVRPIPGESRTFYAVKIQPNPAQKLEDAANAVRDHFPGEEKAVPVTIKAGPAMVIRGDKKMTDGGEVFSSKYVLQDGKTLITVYFVTEGDASVIRTIEKPVMDSLRVVPGKAVPPVAKDS